MRRPARDVILAIFTAPGLSLLRVLVHLWQKTNWKNWVFHTNCFFHNSGWNWGGLEVSRVTARTVRRQRNKFSRDLVLHGIEKSTFQHFPVNWHFNVVEMAIKTLHFVPGLSRTPLVFSPRYLTAKRKNLDNWKSENLKSRSCKVSWFVFSQRWTSIVCILLRWADTTFS